MVVVVVVVVAVLEIVCLQEPFVSSSQCLGPMPLNSSQTSGNQVVEVFEVATFKKTNPDGKVVIAPIFLETIVMLLYFSNLCSAAAYFLLRGGGSGKYIATPALLFSSLPYLIAVHSLRNSYVQKHLLFSQFENFDLGSVACSSESDRDFILAAIAELYGSHEAFRNYVRGSLREELLGPMTSSTLPAKDALFLLSPFINWNTDIVYSMWNAGAPPSAVLFYTVTFLVIGVFVVNLTCINLVILLCDRFAEPAFVHSRFVASWLLKDFVSTVCTKYQVTSPVFQLSLDCWRTTYRRA